MFKTLQTVIAGFWQLLYVSSHERAAFQRMNVVTIVEAQWTEQNTGRELEIQNKDF